MKNNVLNSILPIVNRPQFITVNQDAIKYFCENNYIPTPINWLDNSPINLKTLDLQNRLRFLLVLNSISFCFWKLPKWKIEYEGRFFDGSWGMVAALSKALKRHIPILDFSYLKNLSVAEFNFIIEDAEDKMPLKQERVAILKEVATMMIEKFNSDIFALIEKANSDAIVLMEIILSNCNAFSDNVVFDNNTVYFNKRAQLFVADLNYMINNETGNEFANMDKITALADYKIPYMLREFGILEYNPELSAIIDKRVEIKKNSREEIEIRAFAIWAVELMRQEYVKSSNNYLSSVINDFLWIISQIKNPKYKPYHLTLTTSY
jgi:hypothetical protein